MGTVVRPCHSVLLPISVSSYLEIWLCRRIWLAAVVVSRFCHLNCDFAAAAKRQILLCHLLLRTGCPVLKSSLVR